MREEKTDYLQKKANEIRKTALTMIYHAQSGHPGGSLSAADIVTALYFDVMNVDPETPAGRIGIGLSFRRGTSARFYTRH